MTTIEVDEGAVPLLREGVENLKSLTSLRLKQVQRQLDAFERQYGMDSQTLAAKFEEGLLGDDAAWFEWSYLVEVHQAHTERMRKLESIRL